MRVLGMIMAGGKGEREPGKKIAVAQRAGAIGAKMHLRRFAVDDPSQMHAGILGVTVLTEHFTLLPYSCGADVSGRLSDDVSGAVSGGNTAVS